jgi:hypothetical protein
LLRDAGGLAARRDGDGGARPIFGRSGIGSERSTSTGGASKPEPGRKEKRAEGRRTQRTIDVSPYLEVGQVLTADLKNGGDVLTYTTVAAGIDAAIVTRRAELAATLRYEHQFGWGNQGDTDVVSGLARGRIEVARGLNLEGGALATRTRADRQGADSGLFIGNASNVANLYSVYAGPTLTKRISGLDFGAGYRFGYTKVDVDEPAILAPGSQPQDIFDSSTNHVAWASVGCAPRRPAVRMAGVGRL